MKSKLIVIVVMMLIPATAQSIETQVTPGVAVTTTYTDNVDRTKDNPESDLITTVSPSIALAVEERAFGGSVSYTPSRVYYLETRDNQFWRHRFNLDAWSQVARRLRFSVRGTYVQSEDPADFPSDDFSVRKGREQYTTYSAKAGLDYRFGERDRIRLDFRYRGTENDDPTLEDSQYYQPSFDFYYWFNQFWGTELSGYYQRGKFESTQEINDPDDFGPIVFNLALPKRDFDRWYGAAKIVHNLNRRVLGNVQYALNRVLFDGESDPERIHDISTGFDYQMERDKSLAVQLGYSITQRPGRSDDSGLSGDVTFTRNYQRGTVNINATTGYDYNFFGTENLGLNYNVGGEIVGNYLLSRRWSAEGYANYRYIEYKDQIPQRDDHRLIVGGGISFQILRWLYTGAGYSFSAVESSDDAKNYVDNRIYISLSASPSQPFRFGN